MPWGEKLSCPEEFNVPGKIEESYYESFTVVESVSGAMDSQKKEHTSLP